MLDFFLLKMKKANNIVFILVSSFLLLLILLSLPVFEILSFTFTSDKIDFLTKLEYFFSYTLGTLVKVSFFEKVSVLLLSILSSIQFLFFKIFAQRQRKVLAGKGFFASLSGMFLGLFGVGCVSCGAFILAPILTFLGLSAQLGFFRDHALSISYLGSLVLVFSIYYLLRKLTEVQVCKPTFE